MNDQKPNKNLNETLDKLPFDPMAVLIGVRKRLLWMVVWIAISLAIGITVAVFMGQRTWDSFCVLLYQPPTVELSGRVYEPPVVQTQLNLVKLRPNLEETRAKLQLPVSLNSLAAACDITHPRDTQMLIVKCEWDDPTQSATIANTLATVFITAQTGVRNDELTDSLQYLVNRRQMLNKKISEFKNRKTTPIKDKEDLRREITSYQSRLDAMDVIYQKAMSDRKALKMKVDHVADQIENVKIKIANEEEESAAMEGLSNLNIRVERVRESIADQRRSQINTVALEQAAQKLKRFKKLYENNSVSKEEYDTAVYEHKMALSRATDSADIVRESPVM